MNRKALIIVTALTASLTFGSAAQAHDYDYPYGLLGGLWLGYHLSDGYHYGHGHRHHHGRHHYRHREYRRSDSHGYKHRDRYKRHRGHKHKHGKYKRHHD